MDQGQCQRAENGIYVAASGAWTRAADADSSAEVTSGMFTFVTEGTANGDKGFALTTNDPITLGTTALSFSQFSAISTPSASDTVPGVVELATAAETTSGTDATRLRLTG